MAQPIGAGVRLVFWAVALLTGLTGLVMFFLPQLAGWNRARREAAARYAELGLGDVVELPVDDPGHVYHLFPVRLDDRDALQAHLRQSGVDTLIHYPAALPAQTAFAGAGGIERCPVAARAGRELLSLPLYPRLAEADVSRVTTAVNIFLKGRVLA